MEGTVVSINISSKKGIAKTPVKYVTLIKDFGLKDDAHGGNHHRQVSLLGKESIDMMKKKGYDICCGGFGENITTEGITLYELPLTTILCIRDVVLEVTQIGKTCHRPCAIFYEIGSCIMPKQGIFAKVLKGGEIKVGDKIEVTIK
ncbi:MAG: MOSC domain-containing protein [Thermoplasmatota archaeon]